MFSVSAGKGASVQGLHLSAESSEETISEAKRLSDEISEMLLAAGYFRARIPKHSGFSGTACQESHESTCMFRFGVI